MPASALGIRLGRICDVDEVFINGKRIAATGTFSPAKLSAYDKKRLYEIPKKIIKKGELNTIAIRVEGLFKNSRNGLYEGKYAIGLFSELQEQLYKEEILLLFLISIYISCALYFFIVFFNKTFDREFLYFAAFSLIAALYFCMWTQLKYFITDNFHLLKRIEYILLTLLMPLMMAYTSHFYKRKTSKRHLIYYFLSLVFALPFILSNSIKVWNQFSNYVLQTAWIFPFAYSITISWKEFKKDRASKYMFALICFSSIVVFYDILVLRDILPAIRISHYAFLVFVVITGYIFRQRFAFVYEQYEKIGKHKKVSTSITKDAKEKVEAAIEYLELNYSSDISRENLAAALEINHDYLGKLFKHYTGQKINAYLHAIRIDKCVYLLKSDRSKTITDIAFEVGFESLPTFYRAFQSIYKMKPSEYVKRYIRK